MLNSLNKNQNNLKKTIRSYLLKLSLVIAFYYSLIILIPIYYKNFYSSYFSKELLPFYGNFISSPQYYLCYGNANILMRLSVLIIYTILFYQLFKIINRHFNKAEPNIKWTKNWKFSALFYIVLILLFIGFFTIPNRKTIFDLEQKQILVNTYDNLVEFIPLPFLKKSERIPFSSINNFNYKYVSSFVHTRYDNTPDSNNLKFSLELYLTLNDKSNLLLAKTPISERLTFFSARESVEAEKAFAIKTGDDAIAFLTALIKK